MSEAAKKLPEGQDAPTTESTDAADREAEREQKAHADAEQKKIAKAAEDAAELDKRIDKRIESRIAKQKKLDDAVEAKRKQDEADRRQAKTDKPFVKANPITQSRFQLAAAVRNPWMVTCEKGTTIEQILDGGYWANVARNITPGDEIIVRPDDMAWELVLHVTGSQHLFVHVVKKVLYELRSSMPPVSVPSRYKVEHAGSHHKWRVLRDGNPLKDGFETEDLAQRYAKNHQAAVNR